MIYGSQRKGQIGTGVEPDEHGKEIVPYEPPPIPHKVAGAVLEYFRVMGVEVELDDDQVINGIRAPFVDHNNRMKAQIVIMGGNMGNGIKFQIPSAVPRFIDNAKAIRLLKKTFHKITLMGKLGYLDIEHVHQDRYTDVVQMGKEFDTTDLKLVMDELDRMTKVLGLQKSQKSSKKSR